LVRNDQNDVSGYGEIMRFIGIIDDVLGKDELSIEIRDIKAIKFNEVLIPVFKMLEVIDIINGVDVKLQDRLRVYPNPAHDLLFIELPAGLGLQSVQILDSSGRSVRRTEVVDAQLQLGDLPEGVYVLEFQTTEGLIYKRIVKF
ncbi:MAG: T9SS type A sorting domain-containing protein, partial [Phaeodactylibacter sp.]|nr:T9SS type A sorting domain-containing protein [Phaeodactylibacter sp.]